MFLGVKIAKLIQKLLGGNPKPMSVACQQRDNRVVGSPHLNHLAINSEQKFCPGFF